jgi:hypothetical protein
MAVAVQGFIVEQEGICAWQIRLRHEDGTTIYYAGKKKIALPDEVAMDAEVDLGLIQGVHHLAARLKIRLPAMDEATAGVW